MKWLSRFLVFFVLSNILAACGGGGGGSSDDPGPTTSLSLQSTYLQHRSYESPTLSRTCSWVSVSDGVMPAAQSALNEMSLFSSAGTEQLATYSEFSTFNYLYYDCMASTCSSPIERTESGFYKTYDSLSNDTYLINVGTKDGVDLEQNITFPGEVALPVIESTTMTSHWVDGSLVLNWTNPISEQNWSLVDTLRIVIRDGANEAVFYIAVNPAEETVTIPATVTAEAAALGDGSLTTWGIQTRALDSQGMNYARGYSSTIAILQNGFSYLQHRSFENPAFNFVAGYVTVMNGANQAEETDLDGLSMFDTTPAEVISTSTSFENYNFLVYDCRNSVCAEPREVFEAGYYSRYNALPSDTYSLVVAANNGSTATSVVPYAGSITLPVISSATMTDTLIGGDLQLTWVNPTSDAQWSEVDQIRILLYDGTGKYIFHSILNATEELFTIPAAVLTQAAALGDGNVDGWRVQTRAYDSSGFNNARSYSNTKTID